MVSVALYKGYLRRHPDVPRKWIMPTRQISSKDFKNLRRRRSKALSRLDTATATTSNNPSPNHEPDSKISVLSNDGEGQIGGYEEGKCLENGEDATVYPAAVEDNRVADNPIGGDEEGKRLENGEDATVSPVAVEENPVADNKIGDVVTEKNLTVDNTVAKVDVEKEMDKEGNVEDVNPPTEQTSKNEDSIIDNGRRKKKLEEKLDMLNEKKHGLVQALKQILNAEEELKKRNCAQGNASPTPRHLSDGIFAGEVERAEPEGTSYQNVDTRHLIRTSSESAASDPQTKKLSCNTIPHLARTASGVSGSPSRFASTGQQQGHRPCVSVSGTNNVASSPSSAASGGNSAFRG